MAEASPSLEEIVKLMGSMAAFESLLDATNLNPEKCVYFGIQKSFKTLQEKLAKYVGHEETRDLNVKCICDLCYEEVQIFDCNLKSSLAIHNYSELHKIIVKNKEMNCSDLPTTFSKVQVETLKMKNNISKHDDTSANNNTLSKPKDIGRKQNNLSDSSSRLACTGFGDKSLFGMEGKLSNLTLSQLGIQQLLPLQLLQGVSGPPPQTVAPPNLKYHTGKNTSDKSKRYDKNRASSSATPSSQQSINIHLHMPTKAAQTTTPSQNTQQTTNQNLEKLRLRELPDRAETQLMFKMVKEAEGASWKRENVSKDGNEFECNLCDSRMTSPYDLVNHARGRTHQEKLGETRSSRDTSRNTENRSDMASTWRAVRQAEGKRWSRDHVSRTGDCEFVCNLCLVDLNGPHQLIQHVQGKLHQSELKS